MTLIEIQHLARTSASSALQHASLAARDAPERSSLIADSLFGARRCGGLPVEFLDAYADAFTAFLAEAVAA